MAQEEILSKNQKLVLNAISNNNEICQNFYLTGGTTLSEFYLQHRLSEDLDFFSENEFESTAIGIFWEKNKKVLGIKKIDYSKSFNRNLFFLHLENDIIKTEFTYFPFTRIEKKIKRGDLEIDSLKDIALNKIFTIYQKPRARDFIDIYFVLLEKEWKIKDLVKEAKVKFDWNIDPLQLGSQLLKAKEVRDYPIMIKKIKTKTWQNFFLEESKKIKDSILS